MKRDHKENNKERVNGVRPLVMKKRRDVGALSLATFANAKSKNDGYNPGYKKKQREFYKNAKYVNKYKKTLKQQDGHQNHPSIAGPSENGDSYEPSGKMKHKKKSSLGLKELYEQTHAEKEKARKERETLIIAKTEEREKAEARRKEIRLNKYKKTRRGQPVMKYKIEQLLKSIEGCKE